MPSWRDRGVHPDADCVIKPDTGRHNSAYNTYQVLTYGQQVSTQPTLAAAKAYVEDVYGPLAWTMVDGDQDLHHDPTWGATQEFNDSPNYWVVDRLPRFASATSAMRQATAWWSSKTT
jgi:hypothetical protein